MRYVKQNILTCLAYLLLPAQVFSQLITINGKVVDDKHKPVTDCIIEIPETGAGIYANKDGAFSMQLNPDSTKRLAFYAMGYERKNISIKDLFSKPGDSVVVMLRRSEVNIKGITVKGKKGKQKIHVLGKNNLHPHGSFYMAYGDEVAICLQNSPDNKRGYLKEVFVYITDEGAPGATFRLKISKKDTAALAPGANIAGNILLHATTGNEWVSVDISDKKIPVREGLFIGIEWIAAGNTDTLFQRPINKPWSFLGGINKEYLYNGQVLASTCDYGVLSRTFIKQRNQEQWSYLSGPTESNRSFWIGDRTGWYNPMIYCTYTYSKK